MGAMTPPSRKSCYNFRVIEINRVLDGDTIDVTIDLGFDLYKKERVRVAGVDTPEMLNFCVGWAEQTMQPPLEGLNEVDRYFKRLWDI